MWVYVDGATGKPCASFGDGGQIWQDRDVRAEEGPWVNYTITSPPVIVEDVLVVGSAIGDNRAVESELGISIGDVYRTHTIGGEDGWDGHKPSRSPDYAMGLILPALVWVKRRRRRSAA